MPPRPPRRNEVADQRAAPANPLGIIYYYAALPLIVLGLLLCWRIVRSPFGRVPLAIRETEVRAQTLGYPA